MKEASWSGAVQEHPHFTKVQWLIRAVALGAFLTALLLWRYLEATL